MMVFKNSKSIAKLILLTVLCMSCSHSGNDSSLINFNDIKSIKKNTPILIAHRGGVVTEKSPENSMNAIQLAKQMRYSMVELDIRRSKDGVPVVFHDQNMEKACGLKEKIENLNVDE